jgi:predicted GIY-YIG superfamily endonuclease
MEQLYILQLEGGKYYVGKTVSPSDRYKQHLAGTGAAWTKKFKPVKMIETRALKDAHDETNTTKDMMKKHGVDNVRGGAYTTVTLDDATKTVLERELRSSTDVCYKCGLGGHFIKQCPITVREEPEEEDVWGCEHCDREFTSMTRAIAHERRCTSNPVNFPKFTKNTGACYRCGRASHYSPDCYATKHVDGNDLE